MHVWLNGSFVDHTEAKISIFDAGVQHAVGLFETLLARRGRVFRAETHMQRLAESARELLLTDRLEPGRLVEALHATVERNELDSARVRLTVTGGDLAGASAAGRRQDPTILVVAQPPTAYPEAFFADGVVVRIADGRVNPLSPIEGHKTLSYWPRIHALQQAAAAGAGEALWFSVTNHLASGSVSNVFLVSGGELRTPVARGEEEPGALRAPVLPGVTRGAITTLAADAGLVLERGQLDIEAVLGADEVFLTNSSWGVLPVVGVEQEKIADGVVGPVTRQLREAWLRLVDEETSAP